MEEYYLHFASDVFFLVLQILESKRAVMEGLVPENMNGVDK